MPQYSIRLVLSTAVFAFALAGCLEQDPADERLIRDPATPAVNRLVSAEPEARGDEPPAGDAAPDANADAPPAGQCDPNYEPCVPTDGDVDCARGRGNGPSYVAGPVHVVGRDVYGLDSDGDGIGCERRSARR
jgi:hypothetical protein